MCVRACIHFSKISKIPQTHSDVQKKEATLREKKMENRSEVNLRYTPEVSLHCAANSGLFVVELKNVCI
jgi:hypothetical protein